MWKYRVTPAPSLANLSSRWSLFTFVPSLYASLSNQGNVRIKRVIFRRRTRGQLVNQKFMRRFGAPPGSWSGLFFHVNNSTVAGRIEQSSEPTRRRVNNTKAQILNIKTRKCWNKFSDTVRHAY